MSQDDLAELMDFKTQSGVSQLEGRETIIRSKARKAAFIFRQRLNRDITAEWLQDGGPIPDRFRPAVLNEEPAPYINTGLDERVAALPEALREYVVQAVQLAERVKDLIPRQFIRPPTSDDYQTFHEYLTRLSATLTAEHQREP